MDVDRVLRPLEERAAAIEKLDTYASAGELADAIASVHGALDRSVRLLLRTDAEAPEEARMGALGAETPLDAVVTALRRRDRVSMQLAGMLHEADTIARRVAAGGVAHAADADALGATVQRLRREVEEQRDDTRVPPPASSSSPVPFALEEPVEAVEPEGGRFRALAFLGITIVLLAVVLGVLLLRRPGGNGEREAAIEAFQAGDLAVARSRLETVLADDPADVTARLYLARIHRREDRPREAAAELEEAVALAPQDADVRRELGWLFLELGRPEAAADQFRAARDAEPTAASNWIGLVRALREANDPSADEVLRQAPPEAQAALGQAAR